MSFLAAAKRADLVVNIVLVVILLEPLPLILSSSYFFGYQELVFLINSNQSRQKAKHIGDI